MVAIKAYKVAAALAPLDPAPLSNLSAAFFEAGDYESCVHFGTKALTLLEVEAGDDSRKGKLLARLAKAELHRCMPDDAKSLLRRLAPGQETKALQDAAERMATACAGSTSSKESLRETLLQLPRYRPHLTGEADYFSVGHDLPESQYGKTLQQTTKEAKVVSFLFCGIGDARNMFQTMASYCLLGSNPDQRLHCTILDLKPAVLARDLIIFALLDEVAQTGFSLQTMSKLSPEKRLHIQETLSVVSYIYLTQVMPAYAWERLQKTIKRLLDAFERHEQAIPWAYVPSVVHQSVSRALLSWQADPTGPYATQRFRHLTVGQNMEQGLVAEQPDCLPELKLDHRLYRDFQITLPGAHILKEQDPELARMLSAYRKSRSDTQAKRRISEYIDRTWRSNMTLVDVDWENDKAEDDERQTPDVGFTPFAVADSLGTAFDGIPALSPQPGDTVLTHAELFWLMTIDAISSLGDRLMVEVRLGEMADVLERTRYQALERSAAHEWPRKYSVIHMSNIPDYVGGPLTSFMYGSPLLEQGRGTGLTSVVLRNPPQWKTIDHFLAEYLHMYDRNLIRSHFHMKLSADTPVEEDDLMGPPFPLMDYVMWERIEPRKMAFEQLMPKPRLTHWLHALFLKICLPNPRRKHDFTLVYAPLNLTAFLRVLVHVAELGYPAHWLSTLLTALLEGEITTTARAPRRVVLRPEDVDKMHPSRKVCTKPWALELATLVSLWQGVLPFGLLAPARLVPPPRNVVEYTVMFPPFRTEFPNVPHFMLVFYDEVRFGKPPKELRSLLLDDETGEDGLASKRAGAVRVLTTYRWTAKDQSVTFWMHEDAYEGMVAENWRLYLWRTDSWERVNEALDLRKAQVRKHSVLSTA
ncbi:hypothetical protein SLS64_005458 [Diaporthe eres]|uniref:DUF4470 domain-containing protein n=1 Tax=Diaporthe eres TaxID=83184 RepID=A0ABR1PD17_DIAER